MPRRSPAASPAADASSVPSAAEASPPAEALPIVVALLGLASAVAAVARFPNQPAPPALVDRITTAEQALLAAVGDLPGGVLSPGEGGGTYDDAWVREAFDNLHKAVKDKFSEVEAAHGESLNAAAADLDARLKTATDDFDARLKTATDDFDARLKALADQLAALSRPADAPAKD